MKEVVISIGKIIIKINSKVDLAGSPGIKKFIINAKKYDVVIEVRDWENVKRPHTVPYGEDDLLLYYLEDEYCFCEAKSDRNLPVISSCFLADMKKIIVSVNTKVLFNSEVKIDFILQMIPLAKLLQLYEGMILHASQICVQGKGILFTAPSGSGKTTQAKLWRAFENAEIVCNDRTLIRFINGQWYTFGMPLDGSEPIYSNEQHRLSAIIVLNKGKNNAIKRLSVTQGVCYLMGQTVLNTLDSNLMYSCQMNWLNIMKSVPVYQYECKPDQSAVECLKKQLKEDRVINA